jgi:hypothetical protein
MSSNPEDLFAKKLFYILLVGTLAYAGAVWLFVF